MYKVKTIIPVYLIFSLFSVNVIAQNADIDILKDINQIDATRGFSRFISNTTTAAGFAVPVTMGVIALIENDDDLLKSGVYIGTSLVVDAALTYSLKSIVNRPRPYITYPNDIVAYETLSSKSFPSGHTSFAFAAATSLTLQYPKWYVIVPSYVWACSVGYSRMNLGVHYPSDVLAGAVLGAGSAYITWKVNQWFWKKHENKRLIGLEVFK
jgi:membrane-associated phospholipid phosphatase